MRAVFVHTCRGAGCRPPRGRRGPVADGGGPRGVRGAGWRTRAGRRRCRQAARGVRGQAREEGAHGRERVLEAWLQPQRPADPEQVQSHAAGVKCSALLWLSAEQQTLAQIKRSTEQPRLWVSAEGLQQS